MIKVDSLRNNIQHAKDKLNSIAVDAPGYTSDTDAEIWDWVDWEDVNIAYKQLGETIAILQQCQNRIVQKMYENKCTD